MFSGVRARAGVGGPASDSDHQASSRCGRRPSRATVRREGERAGERYGVPAHEILRRVGEAGYVGGQEDVISDVALQLVAERERGAVRV
ncbi:hypothetical protein ACFRFL_20035 [Streptomyces sp. NPDC056708]|uniref:hypothetical protein n=1 Tax=unclassified Streptomyces TaxID=2593676 RepID=UPI00367E4A84